VYILNVKVENTLFVKTNNYANYQVVSSGFDKLLKINNSYSSLLTGNKKGFAYIEKIKDILYKQLNLHGGRILVIGAGGFSVSFEGTNQNEFDYIDIDSDIRSISEKYFLQAPIKGNFEGKDGRLFLNTTSNEYDVVISDSYTSSTSIPCALATKEYFMQVNNTLKPNGLFIANIIAHPYFNDNYSKRISDTIHSVFLHCLVMPLSLKNENTNIIFVCPKYNGDKIVYRDDKSTVTLDYFTMLKNMHGS